MKAIGYGNIEGFAALPARAARAPSASFRLGSQPSPADRLISADDHTADAGRIM